MKNISVALNIILIIAVTILYYLHFKKPAETTSIKPVKDSVLPFPKSAISIVYVNSDSLIHNYNFYKTRKAELEAKQEKMKSDLKTESDKLQSDAADYQQKASVMADAEIQRTEEQLMIRQQNLMKKKDEMEQKLDDEHSKFSEEVYSRLNAYLKDFNKEKNYTYILGYQKGGGILLANDSLDITTQVLNGLNKPNQNK